MDMTTDVLLTLMSIASFFGLAAVWTTLPHSAPRTAPMGETAAVPVAAA